MRAILLAAGIGARMGGDIHKALLRVGKEALITRNIRLLKELEFDITIVVGHQAEQFIRAFDNDALFVYNRRYKETGSLYSLWQAISVSRLQEDVVVMFADMYLSHVFPLLPNCAMIRAGYDGRGARIYLDKDRLVKQATLATGPDPEGVSFCGLARLSPLQIARSWTLTGFENLPLAYGLIGCRTMLAPITAINVNTPDDLAFAREVHHDI